MSGSPLWSMTMPPPPLVDIGVETVHGDDPSEANACRITDVAAPDG
jgi:hypothetical protein